MNRDLGWALLAIMLIAAGCARHADQLPSLEMDPDSVPEGYARSTAALGWPGATRAFQITPEGDVYNGDWRLHVIPSAVGESAGPPRVIAFEQRWLPIAHWRRSSGPVRWDFEAVVFADDDDGAQRAAGSARDTSCTLSLAVRATNLGDVATTARLDLALVAGDTAMAFVAPDAPDVPGGYRWCSRSSAELAHAWNEQGTNSSWSLPAHASRAARFLIPAYPTPARHLVELARAPHRERAVQARQFWNSAVAGAASFGLGDPDTEDALRAALVVLLTCRERRGDRWIPIGSPLQYRDVWLRDGARAVAALSVMGYTTEARELAMGLSEYQWPQGPFVSQRGQLDGTGQALWALEQAMLRPAPAPALDACADAAIRAWRWLDHQRTLGIASGGRFAEMLPAADPHDNERVLAQLVGNDAWAIAGERSAGRLARAARREAQADSIDTSLARYRQAFTAALARSGSRDIPPSWQGTGRDWGNVAAAWPTAALAPRDPRCERLARRLWAAVGGAGLVSYGDRDSLHVYLGADLGTWALLAGRRAAADSVLEALLECRSASGGAAELVSRRTHDWGRNPPPHASSAAALVSLVRNALVYDDDDTLRLTLGARARWWRGARIRGAPTRWGRLDLAFKRDSSHAEWTWTPVPVWTELTLPPGSHLEGTPLDPLRKGSSENTLLVPPGIGRAAVSIRSWLKEAR